MRVVYKSILCKIKELAQSPRYDDIVCIELTQSEHDDLAVELMMYDRLIIAHRVLGIEIRIIG